MGSASMLAMEVRDPSMTHFGLAKKAQKYHKDVKCFYSFFPWQQQYRRKRIAMHIRFIIM